MVCHYLKSCLNCSNASQLFLTPYNKEARRNTCPLKGILLSHTIGVGVPFFFFFFFFPGRDVHGPDFQTWGHKNCFFCFFVLFFW